MARSEQDILASVRAGNSRAYALLVDRYKDRVMSLAAQMVGNREEAEELVQDAFVRAFHALEEFRGDASFGTWVYRIAYNLCLTKIARRSGRTVRIEDIPSLDMEGTDSSGGADGLAEEIDQKDMLSLLERLIARLPEHYRAMIVLFYDQDLSYREIAAVTGLPLGTVKTNLFRARSVLREWAAASVHQEVET